MFRCRIMALSGETLDLAGCSAHLEPPSGYGRDFKSDRPGSGAKIPGRRAAFEFSHSLGQELPSRIRLARA